MPSLSSRCTATASALAGRVKLGQPVPESNLSSEDDVQVDAEETAFVLRGLSMHLEVLLASAAGRLHEGRYRHKVTFDEHALPARALAREAASIALRRAFLGALYGRGHPYANPGLASATTCPGASPEALGDHLRASLLVAAIEDGYVLGSRAQVDA